MSDVNLPELLAVRLEEIKSFSKIQDGRKMKREEWKNSYAEVVFKNFEQINLLLTSGDTATDLVAYLQELGVFTGGDYRLFTRAYNREKARREKPRGENKRKKTDRTTTAVSTTTNVVDVESESLIVPKRDREEL